MENILIKFETDTAALDEITAKLGTVKQSLAGLVTGASSSVSSSSTAKSSASAAGSTSSKAVDDLTKANQKLTKSNDDLLKKYDEVSKKYQATQNVVKTSSADSKKSLDALSDAQKKVNEQIGNKTATESFRTQLKKMKAEIVALDLAGEKGSARYQELIQKAGALADAMGDTSKAVSNSGSDTQAFDSIAGGLQLATGAFTTYEGADALFGISGENMQKTMERLQTGIALTVGLQQGLNAVQKDSALIVGVSRIITMSAAKAEAYRRLIQIQGTSATVSATIAQKAFNLVANANPYFLVATALLTVVGAMWAWNKGADDAADKQKRINELETLRAESLDRLSQRYKDAGEEREKALANDLELAKASGASLSEIAKKERELAVERFVNATKNAAFRGDEVAALEENKNKVIELKNALASMVAEKNAGKNEITYKVGVQIQKATIDEEGKKKIQDQIDRLDISIKTGSDLKDLVDSTKQGLDAINAKQKVDALKNARSEAIAVAEIKLIEVRKGSAEELAARIGVIAVQRRADLDNVNLTAGERRLKMVKAEKDIADARRAFAVVGLEDEKSLIEAKISLSKKGSDEEFKNQKDLLAKQLQISLSDIDLSIPKKEALNAKYIADLLQMNKDYYAKKSTESLNADISLIESQLASAKIGSNEEYQLKADLIEKKRALDIKGVENSITDEKEKTAKIIEINAKSVQDINDLTYNKRIEGINQLSAIQTLAASQEYIDGKTTKAQFEIDKLQITKDALKAEIALNGEFSKDSIALQQQQADQEIALKQKTEEAKAEAVRAALDTIGQLGNAIMDGDKSRLNQQLSDLDHYYTTDLEAAKKNKDLKYISEKEMNKKQLALKIEIAKADKKQAVFNVIMSTIQAVAGMLAAKPIGPWNWALAAITAAQGAIQIAAIQAQPLPKYAKGKKGTSGPGEMAWVGEKGPEIMFVPNNASIIPAHKSNKVRDAIGIMRDYNIPAKFPQIPALPYVSNKALEEAKNVSVGINYDLLANKIGEQMKRNLIIPKSDQRSININVDQSGTRVTDGDTTTRYRNRKFSGEI